MKKLTAIIAVCALLLAGCSSGTVRQDGAGSADLPDRSETAAETKEEKGTGEETQKKKIPLLTQFVASDLEGGEVTEAILKGSKLTMVNVWATYCGPCIREMPDLGALSKEYGERGVRVLGMVSDAMASDGSVDPNQVRLAEEIIEKTGAEYLHIIPGADLYWLMYQITSVPTTFFVDEDGNQVGTAYIGSKDKAEWQEILEQYLAEMEGAS